jgi:hypothetical protein
MSILPEERDAAMTAVRTVFMERLPVELHRFIPEYFHDDDFLAVANAATNVLLPRIDRLTEQNRVLTNLLKGLA